MNITRSWTRTRWYFYRLTAMSPAEITHRVAEHAKRRRSRQFRPNFDCATAKLPEFPGLRDRLLSLTDAEFPAEAVARYAEAVQSGTYSVLGRDWPCFLDDPLRWHLDPVTGKHWPNDLYCFAVPFRHTQEYGDVKYVWEFNRLQHLQIVAAFSARTGNGDAAAFCRREILSWIESNPPFDGVNWASGIELALRIVSLVVIISLLRPESFSENEQQRILATLSAHGYWIHRFPSRFSSANNHLVAEAAGLYVLGSLAPDLPDAETWARRGRRILIEEIGKQLHDDGVGVEQSPTYTAFSVEWWLLCDLVGEATGDPFPPMFRERLQSAGEHLRWLLDASDNHPRIGDDDEGRVIFFPQEPQSYVASTLAAIAAVTGRGDLGPCADYPHLWNAFHAEAPPRAASPIGVRTFRNGGYSVVRSADDRGHTMLLAFDHGPLGYLSIAAHGHADALAIWLHLDGMPVLVDGGTYLYHSGGLWRDHFRGTSAHNTIMVDGMNSSRISGAFNWSRKAGSRLINCDENPDRWKFTAEHDGYEAETKVIHRRTIERLDTRSFSVIDRLVGAAADNHHIDVGFLIHPTATVERIDPTKFDIAQNGTRILRVRHDGPLVGRLESAAEETPRGWYSRCFGHKEPATRIVFSGQMAAGNDIRTIFDIRPDK